MIEIIPKYHRLGKGFSQAEKNQSFDHPGRRIDGSQSAASWIVDLVSLKKTVLLCSFCRVKFNPRKFNYRKFYCADITGATDGHVVNGMCDSCKGFTANLGGGVAFVHEETYPHVCIDKAAARREARAKAGMRSVSRALGL